MSRTDSNEKTTLHGVLKMTKDQWAALYAMGVPKSVEDLIKGKWYHHTWEEDHNGGEVWIPCADATDEQIQLVATFRRANKAVSLVRARERLTRAEHDLKAARNHLERLEND